jgi:phosphate transport system protein
MTSEHRSETRYHFDQALDELLRDMVTLGSLVLENANLCTEALLDNRLDMVDTVIDADREIDRRYAELERRVFEIIARQQPVAGDLRFLVSSTRILYEIERSGDLAVNCAKALRRDEGLPLGPRLHGLLARLCTESTAVFGRGVEALADMDPAAGPRLDREDDVVDEIVGEFYAAVAVESERVGLPTSIELSRIGRYLERIADHGVNIADNVSYIKSGVWIHDEHDAAT